MAKLMSEWGAHGGTNEKAGFAGRIDGESFGGASWRKALEFGGELQVSYRLGPVSWNRAPSSNIAMSDWTAASHSCIH